MIGRIDTTFYLPLLKLACLLLKIEVYYPGRMGTPPLIFFYKKVSFFATFYPEMYYYLRLRF